MSQSGVDAEGHGIFSLYVVSASGEFQGQLTTGITGTYGEALSLDGKKLAFDVDTDEGPQLMMLDLVESTISEISSGHGCRNPSWSPDEASLAASCDLGEIYVLSLLDATRTKLTSWSELKIGEPIWGFPSWSPDRNWIAYYNLPDFPKLSSEDGIYLTSASCLASPATCKAQTHGPFGTFEKPYTPAWSPDSKFLAIIAREKAIYILDIESGRSRMLIEFKEFFIEGVAWSPDRKWIAFSHQGNIYLISPEGGESILLRKGYADYVVSWLTVP